MSFLSYYSHVLISIILVTAMAAYAIWAGSAAWGLGTILLLAALVIFWVAARRGVPTPANPEKRIRRARENGRALVVYFYSDFSLGCLINRVLVAGTEKEFRGRCEFIYVDVHHREADAALTAVDAGMGDFVLFSATGELVERTSRITREKLTNLLEHPAK